MRIPFRLNAPAILLLLIGASAGPLSAQKIGEFTVSGGLAQGTESGGLGSHAAIATSFAFVKSGFALGPELLYIPGTPRVYGFGGVLRVRLGGELGRAYLVGSLGGTSWRRIQFIDARLFTGSIGAGMRLSGGSTRERLTIEVRYHDNLQNFGGSNAWGFLSVLGGVRFGW